jgi:hypothetical protein
MIPPRHFKSMDAPRRQGSEERQEEKIQIFGSFFLALFAPLASWRAYFDPSKLNEPLPLPNH